MVTLALAVAVDGTWRAWGMEGTAGARVTLLIQLSQLEIIERVQVALNISWILIAQNPSTWNFSFRAGKAEECSPTQTN